jgi:hypothetical protein
MDKKNLEEWIGWLQSEALIDSPNYFTVSIDNWEAFKKGVISVKDEQHE